MTRLIKDKYAILAFSVKAITGVVGTSLVLEQNHPYITVTVLALGAVTNEIIDFYKIQK